MAYKITFTLPGLPKTTNAGGRAHWAVKVKEAKHWKMEVMLAVGDRKPIQPLEKAKITLVRISSTCPDSDGLVSSFKHVIDGLKGIVIKDDKFQNIGMPIYIWQKGKRGQGMITVTVEEVK